MPVNFQPNLTDDRWLQTNQQAVERHLIDDHYVRGFTPGEFVLADATATFVVVTAATPRWPAIAMADAAVSRAAVSFRKPSEWRGGRLRVRYWYTASVGSTNNFAIQVFVEAIRDAEVLTGTTLVNSQTAVAGPAVANTVIRSAYTYTTTSLGSDDELFELRIARIGTDGTDNNVNDFQLLYAEVEHIPAAQVVS